MRGKVNGGSFKSVRTWVTDLGYLSPEIDDEHLRHEIIMGYSPGSNTGRSHAGYSFSCMNRERREQSFICFGCAYILSALAYVFTFASSSSFFLCFFPSVSCHK